MDLADEASIVHYDHAHEDAILATAVDLNCLAEVARRGSHDTGRDGWVFRGEPIERQQFLILRDNRPSSQLVAALTRDLIAQALVLTL